MSRSHPIPVVALIAGLSIVTLPARAVDGDGKLTSETRDLGPFHGFEVGGSFTIKWAPGEKHQIKITTDTNLIPLVQTTVVDGVLKITSTDDLSPSGELSLEITASVLDSVDISGAVNLEASGLTGPKLTVDASGAGSLVLAGKVDDLDAELSGAGSIDAGKLDTKRTAVDISGAGSARVHATEKLVADISGAGAVQYSGEPKTVEKDVSGAGSIDPVASEL